MQFPSRMGFYSCAMIFMSKNTLVNVNGVISEPDIFSSHQKTNTFYFIFRGFFSVLIISADCSLLNGKPDLKSASILSLGKYGHYGLEFHVQFLRNVIVLQRLSSSHLFTAASDIVVSSFFLDCEFTEGKGHYFLSLQNRILHQGMLNKHF